MPYALSLNPWYYLPHSKSLSPLYYQDRIYFINPFLVTDCSGNFTLLTSSSHSHGFARTSGIKALIPECYRLVKQDIANSFKAQKQSSWEKKIISFHREDWTFHTKGIWVSNSNSSTSNSADGPFVTYFGSTNFGYRSSVRDLESGLLLVGHDHSFAKSLEQEHEELLKWTEQDGPSSDNFDSSADQTSSPVLRALLPAIRKFL